MMAPSRLRSRLKAFLKSDTDIYERTFQKVASERLAIVAKHTETAPSLDQFIAMHHQSIEEETERVLDDLCANIIPASQYRFLFTQISLFSIFLLPPVYPLIRYALKLWLAPQLNIAELTACLASICLLFMLTCAAAIAVFRNGFPNR